MNLFAMMETSGSAMQAERMRAEVVVDEFLDEIPDRFRDVDYDWFLSR